MLITQQLFCVYDSKAKHFLPPFCSHNWDTAIRQFFNAVSAEGHDFNKNSQDYTLNVVGTFDCSTGKITWESPEIIAEAWRLRDEYLADVENDRLNLVNS